MKPLLYDRYYPEKVDGASPGNMLRGLNKDEKLELLNILLNMQAKLGIVRPSLLYIDSRSIFNIFIDNENIKYLGTVNGWWRGERIWINSIIRVDEEAIIELLIDRLMLDKLPKGYEYIISLPGPYTYLTYSVGENLLKAISKIFNTVIKVLEDENIRNLVLIEPNIQFTGGYELDLVRKIYASIDWGEVNRLTYIYPIYPYNKLKILYRLLKDGFLIPLEYLSFEIVESLGLSRILIPILNPYYDASLTYNSKISRILFGIDEQEIYLTTLYPVTYLQVNMLNRVLILLSRYCEEK